MIETATTVPAMARPCQRARRRPGAAPGGPDVLPPRAVSEYKGADLFSGRFAELFGVG